MPEERKAGCLYVLATPIGNLGDMSSRGIDCLRAADRVLAEDTRHTRKLLTHFDLSARLVSHHQHNEARTTDTIVEALRAGEIIVLVSDAGTPAISDPGQRLVNAVVAAGIDVVPLPGASAVLAALVASGLPAEPFVFLGFPPRKASELQRWLEDRAKDPATLVFFDSPRRVGSTLAAAADAWGGSRSAVVARELTKAHEEFMRGTLSELASSITDPLRGEITVVVEGALPAEKSAVDGDELRRRYNVLLAEGVSRREALRRLVEATGMRRREIYRALHLTDEPESEDDLSGVPE